MIHDETPDRSPLEPEVLGRLQREDLPSDALEERTIRALRVEGLIRAHPPIWRNRLLLLAAAIALFIAGFGTGRSTAGDGASAATSGTGPLQTSNPSPAPTDSATIRQVVWF